MIKDLKRKQRMPPNETRKKEHAQHCSANALLLVTYFTFCFMFCFAYLVVIFRSERRVAHADLAHSDVPTTMMMVDDIITKILL